MPSHIIVVFVVPITILFKFVGKVGIAPTYSVLFPIRIAIHSLSLLHQKPLGTTSRSHSRSYCDYKPLYNTPSHANSQLNSRAIQHRLNQPSTLFAIMHQSDSFLFYYSVNFSCFLCFYDSLLYVALNYSVLCYHTSFRF